MSTLGGIIDSAVGAATDTGGGTTLQDFLSQFSSSDGVWAKTIDPFASFDVKMRFYPSFMSEVGKGDWKKKLSDSLMSSAKSAVNSLANNLTGGLLGSIMNSKVDIMKLHNDDIYAATGWSTFMEYLAAANLIVGSEDWVGEKAGQAKRPLTLQLGLYCQEVTLPNIEVPQAGSSQSALGEFPINGTIVKTDTNVVTLKIVNTKVPLHERIFYPWLRETTSPFWAYRTQPYTTATITVDFSAHNDISYVFVGCRPQKIIMQQATQDKSAPNLTRDVSFLFDYMFINSSLKTCESLKEKLMSTGRSLVNSAGSMVNF